MQTKHSMQLAKEIFGKNFMGPDEMNAIAHLTKTTTVSTDIHVPEIPFSETILRQKSKSHILFLGIADTADKTPLTLMNMRNTYGMDASLAEPCFYNQDWYVNELFANECRIEFKWYLLRKELLNETRGQQVNEDAASSFPSALVCAFAFFAWFYHSGEYLWKNEFVWCSDVDGNGDRIYVGRYFDPAGIAKNGFSIHRHLRIRQHYGAIDVMC